MSSLSLSGQTFKAGLLAGLSGSQIEGDGYGGYNKLGFIAGGFSNVDLNEKWSTQIEIYFINKGSFKEMLSSKGKSENIIKNFISKINENYGINSLQ